MRRTQIILIDSDLRRRARVAFEMTDLVSYVLPLEDVGEICSAWPEEAVILVEDVRDNLTRLTRMMEREQRELPFVAFSPAPAQPARARAGKLGAAGYLAWPCEASLIHQSVVAAQAAKGPPEVRAARPDRTQDLAMGGSVQDRRKNLAALLPERKQEAEPESRVAAKRSARAG